MVAGLADTLLLGACSDTGTVPSLLDDMTPRPNAIYQSPRAGPFYTPFNLRIEPMERLMLVNIEQDPDSVYIGFEPQLFDDPHTGSGMLVIAYRADGRVDVYHQPGLRMDDKDYGIVGKGLAHMAERRMDDARFDLSATGADLYVAFDDIEGRPIEVLIREDGRRETKPFGLLAPLGYGTAEPPYMPVFLLHDFYFVRRAGTEARVLIDGRRHRVDRLPLPLDGRRMLFTRYSPDLLLAGWNVTHDGPLDPLPGDADRVVHQGVTYELTDNAGHREIVRMRGGDGRREVAIDFSPAFPDIRGLREGAAAEGRFVITGDPSTGAITGDYRVERRGAEVFLTVHPSGGWTPNERRLMLRFIYSRVDAFKNWPKDYLWEARVALEEGADPVMQAGWRRLSGPEAD